MVAFVVFVKALYLPLCMQACSYPPLSNLADATFVQSVTCQVIQCGIIFLCTSVAFVYTMRSTDAIPSRTHAV